MNSLTDPEQFQKWKAHPVTEPFLAYLKDRQTALMEAWGRGAQPGPEWQHQAKLLGDLASLSCDEVRDFYQVDDEQVLQPE